MEDVEKIVIDYITENLDRADFYCTDTMPNPRPKEYMVLVEATGGNSSYSTTIDETILAIQTYAPTREKAYTLARQIHDIMPDLADEDNNVASVGQDVPYN